MAYGLWNNQIGKLSWPNVKNEKKEIYDRIFDRALQNVVNCDPGCSASIIPPTEPVAPTGANVCTIGPYQLTGDEIKQWGILFIVVFAIVLLASVLISCVCCCCINKMCCFKKNYYYNSIDMDGDYE